jgi:rhodanese-related sulfurtransferase
MLFNKINKGIKTYKATPGAVLIDVREPGEFASGHIPGAINMPLSGSHNLSFQKDTPLFLYCLRGSRSMKAAMILKDQGYTDVHSIGGISGYKGEIEK